MRSLGGHWIDVDLTLPARMTAYADSTPVRSMLPIVGRGPMATPTGTFSIIRRVADETMDSATVSIPRNGPGGCQGAAAAGLVLRGAQRHGVGTDLQRKLLASVV